MSISLKDIQEFGKIEFLARQIVEGFITGLHKSPFHGFSVEFAEHRQYNIGQSTRHIDWKVYSKTDKLFVKQYEEETNLRAMIALDASSSMYYPLPDKTKIKYAALSAASMCYMLQKQRDAFGVTAFDEVILFQQQTKSTSLHLQEVFKKLGNVLAEKNFLNKPSGIVATLHTLAKQLHRRSLVVVISDFLIEPSAQESLYEAFRHLKFNDHEVLVLQLIDLKTEVSFEFADKDHVFIDIETGEKLKLNPSDIRQLMIEESTQMQKALKLMCAKLKMDFSVIDIHQDFKQVLLPFLLKRSKSY